MVGTLTATEQRESTWEEENRQEGRIEWTTENGRSTGRRQVWRKRGNGARARDRQASPHGDRNRQDWSNPTVQGHVIEARALAARLRDRGASPGSTFSC